MIKLYAIFYHVHLDFYKDFLPFWKKYIALFVEGFSYKFIYGRTNIITISESTKKELMNIGFSAEKVNIVEPGIDLEYFTAGEKSEDPVILYVGRISKVKSIELLIKSFKEIKEKIKNAKLIIGGKGEELENLFKLTVDLKISEHVTFLGWISEERKKELLQQAWVFVNPSYLEGWGITTIEANACGTPVVASNVSGLRDSVYNPHSGFLVEYGNVEKMTEKISEIISNKEKRKYMEKESREWAEKFDWDSKSDLFLKFINE
jgi:glycosyltransferase involved in cell wall biosynthesis